MADAARVDGARLLGSATQGAWLSALGIDARAATLSKAAPERAADIEEARSRLVSPEQMGDLFKVIALAHGDWPDGAALRV